MPKSTSRLFAAAFIAGIWKYVTVISTLGTVLTIILLPPRWHLLTFAGLVALIILGMLRAVVVIRKDGESKIIELNQQIDVLRRENEELRTKPYDEALLRSVNSKLQAADRIDKDLLRFLLLRGKTESRMLESRCQSHPNQLGAALDRAERDGLVMREVEPIPGRAGLTLSWYINPKYEHPLKDVLFPDKDAGASAFAF